jgi:hypothetical protein
MATTFTKIASVSVGLLGAASIDFTSIPSTYTDLVVKLSGRSSYVGGGNPSLYIKPNGSVASSERRVYGNGSAAVSNANLGGDWVTSTSMTANTFSSAELYFPNYASTTISKSISLDNVMENNATQSQASLMAGLVNSTSAITSLTFATDGNFTQYSTATLYGIKNS